MSHLSPEPRSPSTRVAIGAALILTLGAGVLMRWALAGQIPMVWEFARIRHAHAHLAYYGILIPLAWLGWASTGLRWPSWPTRLGYLVFVVLAIVGFLRAGYAPEAIVGSTVCRWHLVARGLADSAAVAWSGLGLGVLGMASGLLPNTRPVILGAIHFAALSAALPAMAPLIGIGRRSGLWWGHHAAVCLLCLPLVAAPGSIWNIGYH